MHLGAAWAFDATQPPERVRVETVEKRVEVVKAPVVGHVRGRVLDKDKPVARAIVTYDGRADLMPLSTDADGRFGDDVPPGDYRFAISADGYKPATCDAKVPASGGDVDVSCALEALPRIGAIAIVVRDAEGGAGIAGAKVRVVDSAQREQSVTTDAGGRASLDGLPPGAVHVFAIGDDHLLGEEDASIEPRATARVDVPLHRKPKASQLVLTKTAITLKTPIAFAAGTSVLAPESTAVLGELADTLVRTPAIRRIEIQAHTDDAGTPEERADLSLRRANAVRDWLIHRGVDGGRLVATGLGSTRPIAPNVTAANRARNRRIELIVLERD
jgi:outer membrane protein OmpA-like peptidoglycan-associated protein